MFWLFLYAERVVRMSKEQPLLLLYWWILAPKSDHYWDVFRFSFVFSCRHWESNLKNVQPIITIRTAECTKFYWSHSISSHHLHVEDLAGPSSGSTQLYKTAEFSCRNPLKACRHLQLTPNYISIKMKSFRKLHAENVMQLSCTIVRSLMMGQWAPKHIGGGVM